MLAVATDPAGVNRRFWGSCSRQMIRTLPRVSSAIWPRFFSTIGAATKTSQNIMYLPASSYQGSELFTT